MITPTGVAIPNRIAEATDATPQLHQKIRSLPVLIPAAQSARLNEKKVKPIANDLIPNAAKAVGMTPNNRVTSIRCGFLADNFRTVSSSVIPAARIGSEKIERTARVGGNAAIPRAQCVFRTVRTRPLSKLPPSGPTRYGRGWRVAQYTLDGLAVLLHLSGKGLRGVEATIFPDVLDEVDFDSLAVKIA